MVGGTLRVEILQIGFKLDKLFVLNDNQDNYGQLWKLIVKFVGEFCEAKLSCLKLFGLFFYKRNLTNLFKSYKSFFYENFES